MQTADRRRTRGPIIAAGAILAAVLGVVAVALIWPAVDDRQRVVAERGAEIMPFDLDATTHHFVPTNDGGVQTVTADDPSDQKQLDLIRDHLRAEAAAFARGDFEDPAEIHGTEMPGLATLKDHAGRIDVKYARTDTGAQITYTADEVQLIAALHDWFAAQTSDHGEHAG